MSLRKSPCLTPALLASNRRNAKKSTGPRTARGKAWSRLNHMREGWRSPEYLSLITALFNAPPGRAGATAQALVQTGSSSSVHRARCNRCAGRDRHRQRKEMETSPRDEIEKRIPFFHVQSRNVYENKQDYDHLSDKKATFLHNFRTFYTNEARYFAEFCRNQQLFCRLSRVYGLVFRAQKARAQSSQSGAPREGAARRGNL